VSESVKEARAVCKYASTQPTLHPQDFQTALNKEAFVAFEFGGIRWFFAYILTLGAPLILL
jgi:hypothetical protein